MKRWNFYFPFIKHFINFDGNQGRREDEDEMADQLDRQMQERVTAAKLLQGHIADLLPSVLESIESVRNAENKEELQRKLTPWLAEEVASEIGQMVDSRDLLLEIVKEVLQHRAEMYAKFEEDEIPNEGDEGNMWYIEEELSMIMKFLVNIFMY